MGATAEQRGRDCWGLRVVKFSLRVLALVACLSPAIAQERGTARPFDFYVLSLSWSAAYCASGGAERGRDQCQPGLGLGFVVHGLWPQYEKGYPSDCDAQGRPVPRAALELAKGLFPTEGLARHEWRRHGSCSGKSPQEYFADVRRAREAVVIPPEYDRLGQEREAAPLDVQRAFQRVNPHLRPGMMAVQCSRGFLQEVRICMTHDLREFRPCPDVVRNACKAQSMKIPPSL